MATNSNIREVYKNILSKDDQLIKYKTLTDILKIYIQVWDNQFPIDYWWRKKFNISFNSPQHRAMSFIDMKIQHEEEKMAKRSIYKNKYPDELIFQDKNDVDVLTESEVDEIYDNLDIDALNNKHNN